MYEIFYFEGILLKHVKKINTIILYVLKHIIPCQDTLSFCSSNETQKIIPMIH